MTERPQDRGVGDRAEREHDGQSRHGRQFVVQEPAAGVYLGTHRPVLGRHAAHRVGHPAVDQREAVVRAPVVTAGGEPEFEQRGV